MDTRVEWNRLKIVATEMQGSERAEFANLISVPNPNPMAHARDAPKLGYLGTRRRQTLFGLWHLVKPPLSASLHHTYP